MWFFFKLKFTYLFFRIFMRKRPSWILVFFAKNPSRKRKQKSERISKLSKIADITPLLTSCYTTLRKKIMFEMGSAFSPSLLLSKPKYVFVSASSNMMKLGNTWIIKLVVPAWPAFRGQVYQPIGGPLIKFKILKTD